MDDRSYEVAALNARQRATFARMARALAAGRGVRITADELLDLSLGALAELMMEEDDVAE